uniref:uncharacterized protein n=1 Tax=Myxine glutinosa TaxID=7769 RepID=UPI00358E0186
MRPKLPAMDNAASVAPVGARSTLVRLSTLLWLMRVPGAVPECSGDRDGSYSVCRCGVEFARVLEGTRERHELRTHYERTPDGQWYTCQRCFACKYTGRAVHINCAGARDTLCGECLDPNQHYDPHSLVCIDRETSHGDSDPVPDATAPDSVTTVTQQHWFIPVLAMSSLILIILATLIGHMTCRLFQGHSSIEGRPMDHHDTV